MIYSATWLAERRYLNSLQFCIIFIILHLDKLFDYIDRKTF